MTTCRSLFPIFLGLVLSALFLVPSQAQRATGLSAREALDLVGRQFGSEQVGHIVEIRGYEGIPEPSEWEIWVWDERTPSMVRKFWAGRGRATNEGSSDDYYPKRSPFGFVRNADLRLDSKAAFVIAEAEARKAKMGFDSLNYVLRCREFSKEPIWTLELVDAAGKIVGKVYLSGSTGQVLRTVWIYRGSQGRPGGLPRIVDSAEPQGSGGSSSELSGTPFDSPAPATTTDADPFTPRTGAPAPAPSPAPAPGPSTGTSPPPSSGGTIDTLIPPPPVPPEP